MNIPATTYRKDMIRMLLKMFLRKNQCIDR